jgi:hypothetical protein
MQASNKKIITAGYLIITILFSCQKTVIQFGSEGVAGDPNILMIDTVSIAVSTLQIDSFSTSKTGYLIAGSHKDTQLGLVESAAYFEVTAPTIDLRDCVNCRFDSAVLHLQSAGGYMGDTTVPFTLNIHEVTQALDEDELSTGYNVSSAAYNSAALASSSFTIRPGLQQTQSIRLPNNFGSNLFRMLRTNSDSITNADRFRRFLKGFCIKGSTTNQALYYFKSSNNAVIQLYYTIAGATPQSQTADFSISNNGVQFNAFTYDKSGTQFANFTAGKKQLINSSNTGNQSILHYNSGLFPKISLGNLLFLKELHPYIQVMKAELQLYPASGSYGSNTPYGLPPSLELRIADDDNYVTGGALSASDGNIQYGSLVIDDLYGENTGYSYDVTSFVNLLLDEGVFTKRALIVYPLAGNAWQTDQRLLINNSTAKTNAIKLKLYVLGL